MKTTACPGARLLALLVLFAVAFGAGATAAFAAPLSAAAAPAPSPADIEPAFALDTAPYVHLVAAHELRRSGDRDGARAELAKALALDPGLIEPLLARAWLDLPSSPTTAIGELADALGLAAQRFTWQATTAIGAAWGLIAILLVAFTLLAAAHAAQAVGALHHLVTEHLRSSSDLKLATFSAALLLILPLFWGAGPLVAALAILILAGPSRPTPERILTAAGTALIVFLGLAPHVGPGLLRATDFRDKAQVLDLAQDAPLTPALAGSLEAMAKDGTHIAILVHGNALYRTGRIDAAERLFGRYAALRPQDARAEVALGNCRLMSGDANAAVAHYRRAATLDPASPQPLVNLALAYSTLMRFEMANSALADAARLDRSAVAALGANAIRPGASEARPLEPRLRSSELWNLLRSERRHGGVHPPSYISTWLPWQGGSLWPLSIALLMAARFARGPLTRVLRAFWCSGCGSPICRRCVTRRRGLALCPRCERRVRDLPAETAIGLLLSPSAFKKGRRMETWLGRLGWNLFLPGYGLVQSGRLTIATVMIVALAGAWVGFQTGGHPIAPLAPAPAGGGGEWAARMFGVAVIGILALTAVLGMAARPALGAKRRGHISPVTSRPQNLGVRDLRTGTGG